MLIEFKVSNYKSIKDEQCLSLVASNYDKKLPENLIQPNLPRLSNVKLLKAAAIYGANASGKSNFLAALRFMEHFVINSAMRIGPKDPTGTVPFCLDAASATKPSNFEIMAVIDGIRYAYGFSLDKERVHREFLTAYPKGSAQYWFERTYHPEKQDYSWKSPSSFFKLEKDLCKKTRDNSLFVSTGAQFNNAQLTLIYSWFERYLQFINLSGESQFTHILTTIIFEKDQALKERGTQLLKSADFGITAADVSHEDIALEKIHDEIPPKMLREMEADMKLSSLRVPLIRFKHRATDMIDQPIDFDEESAGTRRFFSLLGPWLETLKNGHTVFLDELETSLHPMLIKEFLRLLFNETSNPKGAQVVFTTHNPILLDTDIIRRDQIWFTEKDESGATHLYPLTNYKPRGKESLVRGYLAGRYGAIPFIPKGLKIK